MNCRIRFLVLVSGLFCVLGTFGIFPWGGVDVAFSQVQFFTPAFAPQGQPKTIDPPQSVSPVPESADQQPSVVPDPVGPSNQEFPLMLAEGDSNEFLAVRKGPHPLERLIDRTSDSHTLLND